MNMAIYIKGVDIPTNCTDCRYMPLVGCNPYQDNGLSPSHHRHRTCPLIEVAEPHGRLIATMSDLISREDALKPFCIAPDGTRIPEVDCDNFPVEFSVEFIKKHLLSLPSAEAIHGEWIEVEVFPEVYDIEGVKTWGSEMQCDQCGFRHTAIEGHMAQYNFCPNCGAKMKGAEDD